ncbi:hypothetical protein EMN47_07535 [Prolixibacteraceae bacterium JC049]|nr:hypothetical protein [Prolixibacteraceae bacterium JC049]
MKKLLYSLSLIALLFTACEPMEDIYDDMDANKAPYTGRVEYTLVDDDYTNISKLAKDEPNAANIGKYKNFSSSVPAAKFVPYLLGAKYATLEKGSIANITYKEYVGGLSYLGTLAKAVAYTLTNADYDSMGPGPGQYNNFSSSHKPETYLPDFLKGKYDDAKSGDFVYITYKYYSGGVSERSDYYKFDGTAWAKESVEVPSGVIAYTLSNSDYDSMGAPGKYNNFSSSAEPEDYLPTFLKLKFPYSKNGARIAVVYKYYSNKKTSNRADEYTLKNGVWSESVPTVMKTSQFIHTGAQGWLFDPTVVFKMVKADFKIIVDNVKADASKVETSKYPDSEYYYGASYKYDNFDVRDGKVSSTFATWQDGVKEAIGEVLLPAKFPNAVKEVSGVQVNYKVTFVTYDGSSDMYEITFKCTKSGPNPTFEFVEMMAK